MALHHDTRPADDVRAPAVPRGTAVIVTPVGQLEKSELRKIHARVATHYGLDLHELVIDELQRLVAQRRPRT